MVVEYPNVTKHVITYLRAALATDYPTVRVADTYKGPGVEVWVQRDGGPGLDVVREAARIRVNVYHPGKDSEPVDDLARRVSTLIRGCADGAPVVKASQTSGPSPIPDPSGIPRRFLGFELIVRGTDLAAPDDGSGFDPLDGVSDPWRWADAWAGWAVAAYECSWSAGDVLPYVALTDRGSVGILGVYVGPIPATFAEFNSVWQRQSSLANDADPENESAVISATADTTASGMILVVQYEAGFTHTTAPEPSFDPTDPVFVGPFVIGDPIVF